MTFETSESGKNIDIITIKQFSEHISMCEKIQGPV